MNLVRLKIKRQKDINSESYWEYFEILHKPGMTVISALNSIRRKAVNLDGRAVAPVMWDCQCLQKQCGSCAMIINKKVRLACDVLLQDLDQPVCLEPLSKFKVLRDLVVSRVKDNTHQKKLKLWMFVDGFSTNNNYRSSLERDLISEELIKCIDCGACLEACPKYNSFTHFIGAKNLAKAYRLHTHPNGKIDKAFRFQQLIEPGGVADCDNVQNCNKVCPANLPLADAVARVKRQAFFEGIKKIFG